MSGTLYLVPNLLGVVAPADVLPARTIAIARTLTHWIVETPKPARAFLKSLGACAADRRACDAELPRRTPRIAWLERRASTSACCPTRVARASPIPARLSWRRRIARHSRRAAGRPVVDRARAHGVRHERPAVRLPRLPAGAGRRARAGDPPPGGGLARDEACADLHRDAVSQCGDDRVARAVAARRYERARGARPHAADGNHRAPHGAGVAARGSRRASASVRRSTFWRPDKA